MRTHVTFLSDAFNKTEEKENFINPCCFGEDVADWMISQLRSNSGILIDPEPCQEDWGWQVSLSCVGRHFIIGIGQYEIERSLGWMCFIESRLPFYKKWFGVKEKNEFAIVCTAVHKVLRLNTEIMEIRWHTEDNFMKGNEDDWANTPNADQGT